MNFERLKQGLKKKILPLAAGAGVLAGSADLQAEGAKAMNVPVFKKGDPIAEKPHERKNPPVYAKEADAGVEPKIFPSAFTDKHAEAYRNIDQTKITGSSTWAAGVVEKARRLMQEVKNSDEAMLFVKKAFGAFLGRFQNPDAGKGDLITEIGKKKMAEGKRLTQWDREETSEDSLSIAAQAEGLKKIFEEITAKYGIHQVNIRNELEMLADVSKACVAKIGNQASAERGKKFDF